MLGFAAYRLGSGILDIDELAGLLDSDYDRHIPLGKEVVAEGFGATYSAEIAGLVLKGHTLEELVSKAKISPDTYVARHIEQGLRTPDRLNIFQHRIKALEERMENIEKLLSKLATKEDLKGVEERLSKRLTGELASFEGKLTKEIHAAEDHLVEQLDMVNGKISSGVADSQKRVVKRKRG